MGMDGEADFGGVRVTETLTWTGGAAAKVSVIGKLSPAASAFSCP